MTDDSTPVVLIAEDDPDLADAYTEWLDDSYDVRTAYRGADALDYLDESVDVVLLDRRIPDIDGDEILARIRSQGLTCRVAMVTAVDPDFDIIQMGFDEYLNKPISTAELKDTVERLVNLVAYDLGVREQHRVAVKLATLRTVKTDDELESSEEYQQLVERLGELTPTVRDQVDDLLERQSTEWVLERIVGPPQ